MSALTEYADQLAGEARLASNMAARAIADLSSDAPDDPTSPASLHPAAKRLRAEMRLCRDTMGGTEAIRAGGELYNPRYPLESDRRYEIRRDKVAFFNAFSRTVTACAGLVFRVRPQLGKKMPKPLVDDWEDIDRRGTHGAVFARKLFVDALSTGGPAGILVSYPTVPNAATLDMAQAERMKLRPYWVPVAADDVMSWRTSSADGAPELTQLVIRERTEIDVGLFGVALETRYRVFRKSGPVVTVELWKKKASATGTASAGENYEQTQAPIALRNMDVIPFSPCVLGQDLGFLTSRPPLVDLAYLNIEYHQTRTELSNVRGLACVPTIKRKGYKPRTVRAGQTVVDPVVLGADQVVDVPENGDVAWFSPDVTVLEPGHQALQDLRAEMGAMGLAFLAPDMRAAETATAKQIDAAADDGQLATAASALQDCLERAFQLSAKYRQIPETEVDAITVNTDFAQLVADAAIITALSNAASAGNLPIEDFLAFLERIRVLPEGYDRATAVDSLLKGIRGLSAKGPAPAPASGNIPAAKAA